MIVSPLDNTKVLNPLAYGTKYSDCPNCEERHLIKWYKNQDGNGSIKCPENNKTYKVVFNNHWLLKPLDPHLEFERCIDCIHLFTNSHNWFKKGKRYDFAYDICNSCRKKTYRESEPEYFMSLEDYKAYEKKRHKEDQIREAKKNIFIPNRYVVQYGELEAPKKNQDNGYTYYYEGKLKRGDIVEVPRTWLGDIKGDSGPKLATVVSVKSNYDGEVSDIIRVVKRI